MKLESIRLQNFRSHEAAEFVFSETTTIISGKNGSGKTNILEAIYILLQGTSFRAGDKDLVLYEKDWWRVDGCVDGSVRQLRYQLQQKPSKQLVVNDVKKRFMYRDKLPVVLFEPNDLLFVSGSPSRRRDSVDIMINSLSQDYKQHVARYERTLLQRNNLIKKHSNSSSLADALFAWDVTLSRHAYAIIQHRENFIVSINEYLARYYEMIANETIDVALDYAPSLPINMSESMILEALNKHIDADRIRQTTTHGPHRDDFHFKIRGVDAKTNASRGETRSLILAFKFSYAELLGKAYGITPILLFDDVFSELDETRRKSISKLSMKHQTIITDTDKMLSSNHITESIINL